jgi:hypothetical protein
MKKTELNEMSIEQYSIYEHIKSGKNVTVDACAGSGKSTTILSIAEKMPNHKFLQTTYNSMLRKEIKIKINELSIENLEVQTFHSLCVKYYSLSAHSDSGIRYVLYHNLPPQHKIPQIDILVIDEAQDMTFLYFQFMTKFIRDSEIKQIQLLILGDYMQGLYEFKGADTRFLTRADEIWSILPNLKTPFFEKCTLKMSYRVTQPMADFVNEIMLGETRLLACREGEPVYYIRNSRKNIEKIVIIEIMKIIDQGGKPSDIFVLGASVRGLNSNIRKMENILVENNIPCHVPMLENENINEKVIDGKVVFSTFHAVKGRQRKYVFVTNFDQSYMSFYGRDLDQSKCPNTLYVATTRATNTLYLMENDHYSTDRPLDFLKMGHFQMKSKPYVKFKGQPRSIFYEKTPDAESIAKTHIHDVTPTSLIHFIKESVIEEISPILDRIFTKISGEQDEFDIPVLVKTKHGFYEDVSDLNGIAIPCIYYDHLYRSFTSEKNNESTLEQTNILYETIKTSLFETKDHEHLFLKNLILPEKCENVSDYLFLANVFVAVQERLYFKLKQIHRDEYVWLSEEMVNKCLDRFNKTILSENSGSLPKIETQIIHPGMETENAALNEVLTPFFKERGDIFRFSARTDLITETCVWELKCTTKISIEHMLQTCIYAWIWKTIHPENEKEFKLLNIRTGEILKLKATDKELLEIMVLLLEGKYGKTDKKDDGDFVADCLAAFS